jgi:hypothetical protein
MQTTEDNRISERILWLKPNEKQQEDEREDRKLEQVYTYSRK